ncbi:hypothetical protein ACH5RR_017708 [Cinchona calisaya]|uniref:F-box domain-containing protein n=1 Tax=Cinchona calisaya TaxID=153742 RepID=A0ABD2ZKB8_9GENT
MHASGKLRGHATKKNKSDLEKENFLPDDIIIEILSRLPVESLPRCKCVCKLWCTIINQDCKFDKLRHFDESIRCVSKLIALVKGVDHFPITIKTQSQD